MTVDDAPRPLRPRLSTVVGWLFVLWGAHIGSQAFFDNSFITHLQTGRLILDGTFPRADPYSFTAAGEPWVVQSWLASVLYAGIERLWGSPAVHLLTVALASATGAGVWMLTRRAETLIPRVVVALLAFGAAAQTWSERPLMFGLLGMVLVLLALEGRLPPLALVPVFWVWANAHGSFPLGLVAIVLVLVGTRLDGAPTERELLVLRWAVVGTLLAMVGPLGPKVLMFPIDMLERNDLLRYIIEWQSPNFSESVARFFLLQVVVAVLALLRRPSYRAALPMLVFLVASLLAVRNIGIASLVLVPGMAVGLQGLGSLRGDRRSPAHAAVAGVFAVILAVVALAASTGVGWSYDNYPMAALAHLEERATDGAGTEGNLLAPDFVGNLLSGIRGAGAGVFIDDRFDMYPREVIQDFAAVIYLGPTVEEVLDRREITTIVWAANEPLGQFVRASPAWQVVWQDGTWLVAERR